MKKWNQIINAVMLGSLSLPIIRLIIDYVDLIILRPEVYQVRSAPWYLGGLIYAVITLAVLLVCIVIKVIIKHQSRKGVS